MILRNWPFLKIIILKAEFCNPLQRYFVALWMKTFASIFQKLYFCYSLFWGKYIEEEFLKWPWSVFDHPFHFNQKSKHPWVIRKTKSPTQKCIINKMKEVLRKATVFSQNCSLIVLHKQTLIQTINYFSQELLTFFKSYSWYWQLKETLKVLNSVHF